ncbi:ABC transporter ATP-binding protein [Streptomyces sp. NPDC051162]|uniref:ABC transporter ATP-binding protein n=1 Tax=unclassified Streptomyces TaxID=2593676 RepID=UPI00344674B1
MRNDKPTSPALVLEGVRKRYGDVQAVDGISLTVERGEFFGVLGPNGAGKTTLVEIMEGLRQADGGTVSVLGSSPWPRDLDLLPRIGVQTQSSAFFTRLTAREHLATVTALYGADPAGVDRTLSLVGLAEQRDIRIEVLSGGQRQRLAIASALVHDPELIFLDEPTAALDPQARRALWKVLRALKSEGRTIVYTTHHLDEAEALCDRVAIVVAGSVVALDSPDRLVGAAKAPTRLLVPADRLSPERAREFEGADRVCLEGGSVVIETRAAGPLLAALGDAVGLDGIRTRTATLEDVYLELTGELIGTEQGA